MDDREFLRKLYVSTKIVKECNTYENQDCSFCRANPICSQDIGNSIEIDPEKLEDILSGQILDDLDDELNIREDLQWSV